MVLVIGKDGARWHEPPCTEEEKAEMLERMTARPVDFSSPQHRNRPEDPKLERSEQKPAGRKLRSLLIAAYRASGASGGLLRRVARLVGRSTSTSASSDKQ
jgi:hypothetical protein